ncbi:MAG: type I restriction enzyme HsdR N-terminal domain-containing protein [Raineya sp.]|nr:type I restriction enzyme HsdR N-terminal domain-containing protein [Raineya sp.]
MIQGLNIPQYEHQFKKVAEKLYIYDIIRKKYILLSPEEWVRQQWIRWLIEEYQYPKNLMQVERGHHYQNRQKRTDLVIYDRQGMPFMLLECKAMSVTISEKTLEQAAIYNKTLQAKYVTVTNGLCYAVCLVNEGKLLFLEQIPNIEQ